MQQTHSFSHFLPQTPKLIKVLVIISLVFGCLSGFFHSAVGIKLGLSFTHLFGLNFPALIHGFLWQPFSFMFLPQLEGSLNFYFLFSLCFDLYLLWLIGCKVHQHFGPKTTLKLFFIPSITGCLLATTLAYFFHFSAPLFGLTFAMIPLICAFCFSSSKHHLHFTPMPSMQVRWIGLALIIIYLLQDLSSLHFASLLAHLLVLSTSYLYLLIFHNLKSPFSFTQRFDEFIISKKRKPTSSKIIYLFDEETQKNEPLFRTLNKVKKNERLNVLDKFRLMRFKRRKKES